MGFTELLLSNEVSRNPVYKSQSFNFYHIEVLLSVVLTEYFFSI